VTLGVNQAVLTGTARVGGFTALTVQGEYSPPLVFMLIEGDSVVMSFVGEIHQDNLLMGFAQVDQPEWGKVFLRLRR
jgi:hypothetical protein